MLALKNREVKVLFISPERVRDIAGPKGRCLAFLFINLSPLCLQLFTNSFQRLVADRDVFPDISLLVVSPTKFVLVLLRSML